MPSVFHTDENTTPIILTTAYLSTLIISLSASLDNSAQSTFFFMERRKRFLSRFIETDLCCNLEVTASTQDTYALTSPLISHDFLLVENGESHYVL